MLAYFLAPFRFARSMLRAFTYWLRRIPVIVPTKVISEREDICGCCIWEKGGICTLCRCPVATKTLLSSEQCPDKPPRWLRLTAKDFGPNAPNA